MFIYLRCTSNLDTKEFRQDNGSNIVGVYVLNKKVFYDKWW
jgi:hypothetical protein